MLLKNISTTPADDIYPAMSLPTTRRSPSPSPPPPVSHAPDDNSNTLDDVWGSDSESSSLPQAAREGQQQAHPSDIPRLKQEHTTAGYRDGITVAKATSVQAGFDEGFGLGATIGLRAGELVGFLEGICNSLTSQGDEGERLGKLLEEAKKELSVQSVFGSEYWAEDGTWKFEVPHGPEGEEGTVFGDVAMAHPLVRKWDGVVRGEAERWGVDWDVLKEEEGAHLPGHGEGHEHGHGHGLRKGDSKGEVKSGKEVKGLEW